MSQRIAACCCDGSSPCDPKLGVCCTKVGGVCDCITDKTQCECTELGGVWNAYNLCPNGCKGSCCKYNMSNVLVNCTDNITECDCDAMAVDRRYRTKFNRGINCANNPCSTCLQTHTCQNNRVFNIAVASSVRTESCNYLCACFQGGDYAQYCTRSSSYEIPWRYDFSECQQPGNFLPFVTWFDDENIDPSCFNIGEGSSYSEELTFKCDDGDGIEGTVSYAGEVIFRRLTSIIVPPCGAWIKAGTFKKTMITLATGCACPISGQTQTDFLQKITYCWPPTDWPLFGCNCNIPGNYGCLNFDIANPYNSTTSCPPYEIEVSGTPNGCG